ncbi:MAG: metabolite traffic protein EboE [Planctomycetes bacterium]|nr:metabolite traffic protein EboE [Planctomycetota bacterium]
MPVDKRQHRINLSYCTNVHAAEGYDGFLSMIESFPVQVIERVLSECKIPENVSIGAGLWFPRDVTQKELARTFDYERFRNLVESKKLNVTGLNGFPYANFHAEKVKHDVFRPGWDDRLRPRYTRECALTLAPVMTGEVSSVTTVPGGPREIWNSDRLVMKTIRNLVESVIDLYELWQKTGRMIILAIEPEPMTMLETTGELIDFLRERLIPAATARLSSSKGLFHDSAERIVRRHVGICLDLCHQAVMFEDPEQVLLNLSAAGIRVGRVQVSSALRIPRTQKKHADALRRDISKFRGDRYLHQIVKQDADGAGTVVGDLDDLGDKKLIELASAGELRCHYHVPIYLENIGSVQTTRDYYKRFIKLILEMERSPEFRTLFPDETIPLEIETYTMANLLGESGRDAELRNSIFKEFEFLLDVIKSTEEFVAEENGS